MRKNINKLATLVMTGALAASMSFAAFALTGDGSVAGDNQPAQETTTRNVVGSGKTMTVHKKVTTDGKTYAPNGSFSFTVTSKDITTNETKTFAGKDATGNDVNKTYDIKKGVDGSVLEVTKATFAPDALAKEYDATFTVTFDESKFATAGVYKYELKETPDVFSQGTTNVANAYPGIVYDSAAYTMYVFVVNGTNGREVKNVVIMNKDGDKVDTLTNKYGDGSNNDAVHDLTISKVVTGSLANMSEKFNFYVKIDSDVTGEKFSVYEVTKDTDGKDVETLVPSKTITGDDTNVVTLENIVNGTTYRIHGLTAGDIVSVSEKEAGANGYVTTYDVTADGDQNKSNQSLADDKAVAAVKATADGATLTITNKRDAVTPTGVAMDIAPYALMVALAGGAAATFLRKKESFED